MLAVRASPALHPEMEWRSLGVCFGSAHVPLLYINSFIPLLQVIVQTWLAD